MRKLTVMFLLTMFVLFQFSFGGWVTSGNPLNRRKVTGYQFYDGTQELVIRVSPAVTVLGVTNTEVVFVSTDINERKVVLATVIDAMNGGKNIDFWVVGDNVNGRPHIKWIAVYSD